ncbi:MAG: MBOAT family protein [Lachnospiraceae bacterium]|nr:MBOAT family protein [Lachnospiraceae bacterium]
MVFSSLVFLWVFFPLVFVLSRIIRAPKYQNILLLFASLIFYAWGEPKFILLLLFSICMNWAFGLLMEKYPAGRSTFLLLDIVGNLGFLGYFKYANFVLNTMDHLVPQIALPRVNVVMPIGISFFTFQAMTYVIDLYRGQYKAQKNLLHLALYISFFPQLIAGPIVKYREVNEQMTDRAMTPELTASGTRRFIYGLGKKVVLANSLAVGADAIFALPAENMTMLLAWAGAFLYTLQIYYDFSGYSDMAIGMGRMFGFRFLENFDHPYLSLSITEFWRRWHISLGSWFREYLYIPLGGNRKGKLRTYINLFVVFALTGLWHGASWNFVGWGLYHGFFTIIERLGLGKLLKKLKGINWIYTFLVVLIGWIFFRVESVRYGLHMVVCMFLPQAGAAQGMNIFRLIDNHVIFAMCAGMLGSGILQLVFTKTPLKVVGGRWKGSFAEMLYLAFVMLYCVMLLANDVYNPFIYYRF